MSTNPKSEDVQKLYEKYPFPYGTTKSVADTVFAAGTWLPHFRPDQMAGMKVLEAGCGTGNKLTGLARLFPKANFVGVDLSEPSLNIARELIQKYELTNVEVRQGDLMKLDAENEYDAIQSIGVVHHMEDPQTGLNNLTRALKEDGLMLIWLYHPIGEFERLTARELLHTLWGEDRSDLEHGEALMKDLGLALDIGHYGKRKHASDDLEGKADAFMHPIVEAYRLDVALEMFKKAGCTWAGIDFLNLKGDVKSINLEEVIEDDGSMTSAYTAAFLLDTSKVFPTERLLEQYRALDKRARMRALELALKPRGYMVVAGKGTGHDHQSKRIAGNIIRLD